MVGLPEKPMCSRHYYFFYFHNYFSLIFISASTCCFSLQVTWVWQTLPMLPGELVRDPTNLWLEGPNDPARGGTFFDPKRHWTSLDQGEVSWVEDTPVFKLSSSPSPPDTAKGVSGADEVPDALGVLDVVESPIVETSPASWCTKEIRGRTP